MDDDDGEMVVVGEKKRNSGRMSVDENSDLVVGFRCGRSRRFRVRPFPVGFRLRRFIGPAESDTILFPALAETKPGWTILPSHNVRYNFYKIFRTYRKRRALLEFIMQKQKVALRL